MSTGSKAVCAEQLKSSAKLPKLDRVWRWHAFAVLVLLFIWRGSAGAQTTPNSLGPLVLGEPVTANGSGASGQTASSSPIFVDATQFTSGAPDVCKQINNAIALGGNGGVVDARGFIGDQKCASNMFPSNNPTGKLLLGNVTIHSQVSQVQPSKFQVEGVGWSPDVSANTHIVACTGTDTHCTGSLSPAILWCWGAGGACSSSTNKGISFGALTQHITFDCAGLSGCTAMQAYWVQEGTGCWHCQFWGWYNGGIGLDVCDGFLSPGKGSCQNSSFFDLFASLPAAVVCTTTAVPIRVNSGGSIGPKFIKEVTVDASKCSPNLPNQTPYDSFRFSSQNTTLEQVLVGQGTVVGLRVGGDSAVTNVTINNVQDGTVSTDSTGTQCLSQTGATTVLLDSANTIKNTTLLSIGTLGPGNPPTTTPPTNIIVDCTNGNVLPRNPDVAVAQYTLGPTGLVVFTSSSSVPTFPSAPRSGVNLITASRSMTAVLDMTKGSVQQISCTALTGASVTVSPINLQSGMEMTFIFGQSSSTTGCTVNYPTLIMHNATAVSSTPSSVTTQKFVVSNNGSDLYAVAAGTACASSCGTP
jgi:hypothetical protein